MHNGAVEGAMEGCTIISMDLVVDMRHVKVTFPDRQVSDLSLYLVTCSMWDYAMSVSGVSKFKCVLAEGL